MKTIKKLLLLVCAIFFAASFAKAQISIGISVGFSPPALPVYVQPACPVDGYMWVPGYWAYNEDGGYYWVPGVWAAAPRPGYLWTPAYWGFEGGVYGFHAGYWGVHVGYYGGINYGFGYGGVGFGGGRWEGGSFRYNTAVVNVNRTVIHNTYIDRTVVNNVTVNNHTSFNGPGGVTAKPRPEELAAMKEQHIEPTKEQQSHEQHASQDKSQFAKVNGGHPAAAAMNKVGGKPINEHGQVAANSKLGNQNPNENKAMANKAEPAKPAANTYNKPANQQNTPRAVRPANANKPAQQQPRAPRQQQQQARPKQQNKPQPKKGEKY